MNESEERWARMERTMQFLLESDARIAARLDALGLRLDAMGDRLDSARIRSDKLTETVKRRQTASERADVAVDSLRVVACDAVGRMEEIAERIRRLAEPVPPCDA